MLELVLRWWHTGHFLSNMSQQQYEKIVFNHFPTVIKRTRIRQVFFLTIKNRKLLQSCCQATLLWKMSCVSSLSSVLYILFWTLAKGHLPTFRSSVSAGYKYCWTTPSQKLGDRRPFHLHPSHYSIAHSGFRRTPRSAVSKAPKSANAISFMILLSFF